LQADTADQSKLAEPTAACMVVHSPSESTVGMWFCFFFSTNTSANLHLADGINESTHECKLPRFYLLNATSLAKNNAKEQLTVDMQMVRADIVMTVESWFSSKNLEMIFI
jgi:hypothetical protein